MTVSIIIAVKTWQKNLEECVDKCLALEGGDFEVIVLPDFPPPKVTDCRVRVIPTGQVSPPRKRDLGIRQAKGEIIAFLDDDAYPCREWLIRAREIFSDEAVAAVGGPAITPASDSNAQKASGLVYASAFVSAGFAYRYVPSRRREVEDFPSCNLLVRKAALDALGGFNTAFWPGEDTKLCLEITRTLRKKIVYDPKVLVYHHRRRLFLPHLRQVASYALHRGYFVKRFPATSLRPAYFVPSAALLALLAGGFTVFFSDRWNVFYLAGVIAYMLLSLVAAAVACRKRVSLISLVWPGIVLTHLTYGFFFLKGLLTASLKEERAS